MTQFLIFTANDRFLGLCAFVVINEGKAALEDVLVDGVSIRDAVMDVK